MCIRDSYTSVIHQNEVNSRAPYVDLLSRCRFERQLGTLKKQFSRCVSRFGAHPGGKSCQKGHHTATVQCTALDVACPFRAVLIQPQCGKYQPCHVPKAEGCFFCSITNSGVRNIVPKRDGVRNVVFISGRVHPGETPASHVVHGLVEFLLSSDPSAVALRKIATWVIVPMLNPDGVSAGNYRCDAGKQPPRPWTM